jgi:hypothetical protein
VTFEGLLPHENKSANGPYPILVESGGYSEIIISSTNQMNMVILEKINPRLTKKFHAVYGNLCSKHIASCHIRSQMNPFGANALCFFLSSV